MLQSSQLQTLRSRYLQLTNQTLPDLAKTRAFSVRFNHCFQRIILDNLFQTCWYEALESKTPAYQQLSTSQLEAAIDLAEAIIEQPDEYLNQLNDNSLRWRGHKN
ncbi:MAG: hypothetical protein HC886_07780 [Leptolyngbyaceae cyanobacterium SM1_1_3]|nr:hypothetical protein [Leptolyngbyaceae cyanobacterium SM1_1_3]NJN01203.1 hypothetical protein [Leptolyngbyaceae cyanobacterium RM1_1_2]NJO09047.1 hypothetical protein [Leptolyngbyaceae cyanobacterium SL_1_1]